MFQNAFNKLELADVATLLDRLNPAFDGTVFDPIETTVLVQDLSFYPGHKLVDIADYTAVPTMRRFAVCSDDEFFVLNFSNEPIYEFNKTLPIILDEQNIADYTRFFFTYVRGRHGRFMIVENVDDVNWRDDPPPSARKAVGGFINPVFLEKVDDAGVFHVRVCMVFKDSLFKSLVKIDPNGFVSLNDEELLVEDLPVLDDIFGQ